MEGEEEMRRPRDSLATSIFIAESFLDRNSDVSARFRILMILIVFLFLSLLQCIAMLFLGNPPPRKMVPFGLKQNN